MVGLGFAHVREQIRSNLDDTNNAVSGGALHRNASIIEDSPRVLWFTIHGDETPLGTTHRTFPPDNCPVCAEYSVPKTIAESFQNSLFQKSSDYYVPLKDTHSVIRCTNCSGSGEDQCWDCGGTGFGECSSCSGDGYEEVSERCEACDGESERDDCQVCGGLGRVEYRESCGNCDGSGQEECSTCHGHGLTICYDCGGTGSEHEHEAETSKINREFIPSGLSDSWSSSYREIAATLDLSEAELHSRNHDFKFRTKETEAYCVSYEYGSTTYRVIVIDSSSGSRVFWNPETGYPKTTLRRKIGDIKSRILW